VSYQTAAAALRTLAASIDGIKAAVHGMPASAHNLPLAILEPDNGERSQAGQVTVNTYRVALSVVVAMQGMSHPDNQIAAFIDSVPNAIDDNPTLTSTCNVARVVSWTTGYLEFGDPAVNTRRVTFSVEIRLKHAYQGG
jgi:hypothetical protein